MLKTVSRRTRPQSLDAAATHAHRRFGGGAARYQLAMATAPNCRQLELTPLHFLLPKRRSCLLDLFSGQGFASKSLRGSFDRTCLVDSHEDSRIVAGSNLQKRRACALSAGTFDSLPPADLIVCLAGFHHVLGPGPIEDKASHRQQRLDTLRLWRSRLASGGRLIIADVPSPGADAGWNHGPLDGLTVFTQEIDIPPLRRGPAAFISAMGCDHLRAYLAEVTGRCRDLRLGEAEPARFFDQVVSKQSPYGHTACFDSPHGLAELFREAGFENVVAFVAPTPWLFSTETDALWFVHELLGIGQACSGPSDLSVHEQQLLRNGIVDHLGLHPLPDGSWAISWKLMYVTGDRP